MNEAPIRMSKKAFNNKLNDIRNVLINVEQLGGEQVVELYNALSGTPAIFENLLSNASLGETARTRTFEVENIKKYDILYVNHGISIKHFMVVHRVVDNKVYGVTITSKQSILVGKPIKKNRMFKDSYYTHLFQFVEMDQAQQSYVATLSDGRREFDEHIDMLKEFYRRLL